MTVDHSAEVLRLRATVRDLLALSSIPEVWGGREPPAIAAELADVMIQSLQLDFAFVRLCDPTGFEAVEVKLSTAISQPAQRSAPLIGRDLNASSALWP